MEQEVSGANLNKRKFFSELAIKNLKAARMLSLGGVLVKSVDVKERWRNISEHCLVQSAGCEVIAETLNLPQDSRQNLVMAAIIHDWDKVYQLTGLSDIDNRVINESLNDEEAGKLKYDFFEKSEEHSINGMRNMNIPEIVIQIATADGHPALERVSSSGSSIEERILHYLGSITDGSNIVALDERIDSLEKKAAYKMMNEYGRKLTWTKGKTLYEMQRETGHQIESEIVKKLIDSGNLDASWAKRLETNASELPIFIATKIQERYSA